MVVYQISNDGWVENGCKHSLPHNTFNLPTSHMDQAHGADDPYISFFGEKLVGENKQADLCKLESLVVMGILGKGAESMSVSSVTLHHELEILPTQKCHK